MDNSKKGNEQQKVPKLKLFQTIQKNFASLGIDPNSAMPLRSFNEKILMGLLALGSGIIFMLMFIFNEADTFSQYTQSIYFCSALILAALVLLNMGLNMSDLFKLISETDCFASTS